ncbi:MAG: hypothetical protein E7260_09560 [Lachnospiraceae bacterium]|nr:hypothetical protein [Lachnospiraceae bacterium]
MNVKNLTLMMKDTPVLSVNLDEGEYIVLNENLLPFDMKGRLRKQPELTGNVSYDAKQLAISAIKNYEQLLAFLSHRVLPISRENAKKIYQLFGVEQLQDEVSKAKIAILCRAVSLQDNYWVKLEDEKITWNDVNLRTNSLSEIVTQVSLHGSSLSLSGMVHTPELTGQGAYAKAWIREEDGLYLHKRGANGSWESKIEVMVSNLLDFCNVPHLKYESSSSVDIQTQESVYTCKCKCMTTEDISILSGMDFTSWCNVRGVDPYKEALKIDPEMIYKMWIVDYLISNRDRHGLNWGFFYDCNTMEILGCHPLYDHNNAFDNALMYDKDATYLYDQRMTMREAAKRAMEHVDFHFTKEITRDDFLTERQYKSFMDRTQELGIKIKSSMSEAESEGIVPSTLTFS